MPSRQDASNDYKSARVLRLFREINLIREVKAEYNNVAKRNVGERKS